MHDFLLVVVQDFHLEGTHIAETLPEAAIGILYHVEHLLSYRVKDDVFVVGFKADDDLQQFQLLLHKQLVHESQIFQTRWTVGRRLLRHLHPLNCVSEFLDGFIIIDSDFLFTVMIRRNRLIC